MRIAEFADDYGASTDYFLDLATSVESDLLDLHHPGEWSTRQVIHHMADSETQSYARLRRLLAEPEGSVIQGYDEAAWADCPTFGYRELPIENSLLVVRAVRSASRDVIARMTESDLDRFGTHTESGPYTVRNWLTIYVAHPREHAAQIERALSTAR